jgi:hypothetical protein
MRPYVSLMGAASTGPKPRPSTYSETGSRAAVGETWNCWAISVAAGE